jgi:hypothetical protein
MRKDVSGFSLLETVDFILVQNSPLGFEHRIAPARLAVQNYLEQVAHQQKPTPNNASCGLNIVSSCKRVTGTFSIRVFSPADCASINTVVLPNIAGGIRCGIRQMDFEIKLPFRSIPFAFHTVGPRSI